MLIKVSETLLRENKKSSKKILPLVGIEPLGSLYSHALLILTESFKFKNQVVH